MRKVVLVAAVVLVTMVAWAKGPAWYRMEQPCGQVTSRDPEFEPANAKLTVFKAGKKNLTCCKKMAVALKTTTDADGKFELKGLKKGTYWFCFKSDKKDIDIPIRLQNSKPNACETQKVSVRKDGSVQVFIETSTE